MGNHAKEPNKWWTHIGYAYGDLLLSAANASSDAEYLGAQVSHIPDKEEAMHWLKVEREFYNLDCITKVAYSLASERDVTVYSILPVLTLRSSSKGRMRPFFCSTFQNLKAVGHFSTRPKIHKF